jgi:hypothetical protein
MRLPPTVYNQLLEGLGLDAGGLSDRRGEGAGADPPAGVCKRRSSRRRLNEAVYYVRHGTIDFHPQSCTLIDVSRDGACVLIDAMIAPGEKFVLYLPRAKAKEGSDYQSDVIALLCTARSSRLKSDGRFRIGAEFTDPAEAAAEHTPFARTADSVNDDGE